MKESELIEQKNEELRQENTDNRVVQEPRNASESEIMKPGDKVELFSTLGVDLTMLNDQDTNQRVADIVEWVSQNKADANHYDIIFMIQEVKDRIGIRPGEEFFTDVWTYVRLDLERKRIENEMGLMEKRNG